MPTLSVKRPLSSMQGCSLGLAQLRLDMHSRMTVPGSGQMRGTAGSLPVYRVLSTRQQIQGTYLNITSPTRMLRCLSSSPDGRSTAQQATNASAAKPDMAAVQHPASTSGSSRRRYRRSSRKTTTISSSASSAYQQGVVEQQHQPLQQQELYGTSYIQQGSGSIGLQLGVALLQQRNQQAYRPTPVGSMLLGQSLLPTAATAAAAAGDQHQRAPATPDVAAAGDPMHQPPTTMVSNSSSSSSHSAPGMSQRACFRSPPEAHTQADGLQVPKTQHYTMTHPEWQDSHSQPDQQQLQGLPEPAAGQEVMQAAAVMARAAERRKRRASRAAAAPGMIIGAVGTAVADQALITAVKASAAAGAVKTAGQRRQSNSTAIGLAENGSNSSILPVSSTKAGASRHRSSSTATSSSSSSSSTGSTGSRRRRRTTCSSSSSIANNASATASNLLALRATAPMSTTITTASSSSSSIKPVPGAAAAAVDIDGGCGGHVDGDEHVLFVLADLLAAKGIELSQLRFGTQRAVCPECQGGSSQEDCFVVTASEEGHALWCCHRASCGFSGRVTVQGASRRLNVTGSGAGSSSRLLQVPRTSEAPPIPPDTSKLQPLSPAFLDWFAERGISAATLQRNHVQQECRYCKALQRWVDHIAFPFFSAGSVVNIKYRALPKHFQQSAGGDQVFYGLDDVQGSAEVIIVEGEMDKLAIEEATGLTAVLSVPAGAAAPQQHQSGSNSSSSSGSCMWPDKKFAYAVKAQQQLGHCEAIVIAVDGDEAGWHTAKEIAERLGRDRCWYLPWPSSGAGGQAALHRVAAEAAAEGLEIEVDAGLGCKDANDMLMCYGKKVLALYLKHAPMRFSELEP